MTPENFRLALERANLSQAAFARLAKLDPVTVNKWCRGKRKRGAPDWAEWALAMYCDNRALSEITGDRTVYV
jgi:DNA-binding transcriptional regulator YiaG